MATSFLYRRYRDRIKDWIKPQACCWRPVVVGIGIATADETETADPQHYSRTASRSPRLTGTDEQHLRSRVHQDSRDRRHLCSQSPRSG